ncbi:MAG: murein biosynthesis integral membrane protein MurJ [Gammaproteobacteria bacterium]|nr:murein biosynthesis integral membrane protein MurJ [Gammaproteobacteria bacterium]
MAENDPNIEKPAPRLLRSTSIVGGMTLLSRILGLVRDIVFARFFGAGVIMDAFFVAFKIPNIFRRFFAEGAFSQGFVPVFTEYDETRSPEEVQELLDRVTGTLGLLLLIITVIGVLASPLLIGVFGLGWVWSEVPEDADKYALAVQMLRLTFPYLFFVSLVALCGGILNTYQRFAAPAFAPVLLNIILISFAAFVAPYYSSPGIALAAGVFAAGAVQLLFLLPFLAKLRVLPRPRWGGSHPGVRKIGRLMVPAIFGSSVAQINILLDTLIASFLVTGSISWLYYSDRLMEFPLGVFGIALATVILPNLSRQHAAESTRAFSAMLDWAMRLTLVIALPATIGLFMLAGPLLTTIFFGGQFDEHDVSMAVPSLMAYSAGLAGFIFVKVLAPGFFARQDTKTPVRIGIIALVINMVLNIVIVVPWVQAGWAAPHAGLALATAGSAFINAGLLWLRLHKDQVWTPEPGWGRLVVQVGVACGVMAVILNQFVAPLSQWYEADLWTRCLWLAMSVGGGCLVYVASLFAVGLRPSALRMTTPDTPV